MTLVYGWPVMHCPAEIDIIAPATTLTKWRESMLKRLNLAILSFLVTSASVAAYAAQACDATTMASCGICTKVALSAIANYNTESRQSTWKRATLGACASASENKDLCDRIAASLSQDLKAADLQVTAGKDARLNEVLAKQANQICLKMDCCSTE